MLYRRGGGRGGEGSGTWEGAFTVICRGVKLNNGIAHCACGINSLSSMSTQNILTMGTHNCVLQQWQNRFGLTDFVPQNWSVRIKFDNKIGPLYIIWSGQRKGKVQIPISKTQHMYLYTMYMNSVCMH